MNNDAFNHTVSMTSDGINDNYLVGGSQTFSFPTGTAEAAAYLSFTKQLALQYFNLALTEMINKHYNLETRFRWMALYLEFQNDVLSINKYAYVKQLLTWGLSISQYTNTFVISVMSQTDPAVVAAMKWDFIALEASDPNLTLIACMQIVS